MSNIINLSDPPLPNGVLIGGVANFFTDVKPVARIDGSALVIGDRWVNLSTGVEGFWNGTYWLSTLLKVFTRYRIVSNSASLVFPTTVDLDGQDVGLNKPMFIERCDYSITLNSTGDANNYRAFQILRRVSPQSTVQVYLSPNILISSAARIQVFSEIINLADIPNPSTSVESLGYTFNFLAVGSAPNGSNPNCSIYFREIL